MVKRYTYTEKLRHMQQQYINCTVSPVSSHLLRMKRFLSPVCALVYRVMWFDTKWSRDWIICKPVYYCRTLCQCQLCFAELYDIGCYNFEKKNPFITWTPTDFWLLWLALLLIRNYLKNSMDKWPHAMWSAGLTHPFPNCTVEVWEWISNYIP